VFGTLKKLVSISTK